MVQFIREQTRQYAADQSGAIETAQLAQNVKEWGGVVQSVGSIAQSIEKQRQKDLKLQEEADEQMINTQIGSKAQTELLKWNVAQIEAGVDPNSDEYTQKLYAKKEELYQPYIDQMTSEKGRAFLQKQGLDTAERIRQANIGKVAKNRQKAQAQVAFASTADNMANEAREFGKIGDWNGFKEATTEDKKALDKYAKANNLPKWVIDKNNLLSFELGQAESDPELILKTYGTKEELREIKRDEMKGALEEMVKEKSPTLSQFSQAAENVLDALGIKKEGSEEFTKEDEDKTFDVWYDSKKVKEEAQQRKMAMLPEDAVKQVTEAFVVSKKQEQLAIKEKMKGFPKNSTAYQSLEKEYNDAQSQIENPDEYVADIMTQDIKKAVLPIAREQYQKNKLLEKKIREDSVKEFYTMPLNPNTSISFPAQMAAALRQPEVEDLFQMSVSNEEMHKAYNDFAESKTKVSTREYATFEATQSVADEMYKFLHNPSTNVIELMKGGLELLTAINNSDLTQAQKQDLNNIMYGVFKDRGFADLAASVLEDNNKYFPDVPVIGYGAQSMVPAQNVADIGLPSTDLMMIDIDSVKNYLDTETLRISTAAINMLGQVAQLPTAEDRLEGINQVRNFVATEKQKVYDNAMDTYGLNMKKLRENKRLYGQAFTQLASRVMVEYMGDDPYNGKPLFRQLDNYKEISEARKRILEGLEASKQQKKGKEE